MVVTMPGFCQQIVTLVCEVEGLEIRRLPRSGYGDNTFVLDSEKYREHQGAGACLLSSPD